ncbi:MAG: 2-oxoacid:acceptor oxidoreductase subunit alpha [Pseudomonadota bacterium]|nr:2-oxoacid:acceptor oxidoreductase subunit alpha [Pseudomonadota bacterium]
MRNLTIAMTGSGGTGVVALGEMLLRAAAGSGYYGILRKTFGPQIRGGESAAVVRLGPRPLASFCGEIDLLLVLDWSHFQRFADEIPLSASTLIIEDTAAGVRPPQLASELLAREQGVQVLDFSGLAQAQGSAHSNIALLGYVAAWLGCDGEPLQSAIDHRLHKQGAEVVALAHNVARVGADLLQQAPINLQPPDVGTAAEAPWLASGNQLAGLGALEAGIRFVAAYPITPASDALEWMAGRIESLGGRLVQAEDELAAVNMAIGAGFGGVPAMTATSGPGLALMSEAMGLAVASETPLVVLDVMRGGPSTGIPTKSEQSDFNLAVYGLHGDAPRVVLASLSLADCHFSVAWATQLASERQTLVLVLSDQFLGQSMQVLPPLPALPFQAELSRASLPPPAGADYFRYLDTDSGISPMALPGQPGGEYTADGLEHSQSAVPSARAQDHEQQLAKRQRKLQSLVASVQWGEVSALPQARILILCWGSLFPVTLEAQQRLQERGTPVTVVGVRLLAPLPLESLLRSMQGMAQVLLVEQNHQAQFGHYLQSHLTQAQRAGLPELTCYSRPGPRLFTPQEIMQQVEGLPRA